MSSFDDLFAQHVATGMARQLALADLLGDRGWQLDLNAGLVTFGSDLRYPVQLLGTESHSDGTWLWAWANSGSNLDPNLLQLAGWLREHGRLEGVRELTEPTLRLDRADGHRLSLVASGLTGRSYYRGTYNGGAIFFHLDNLPARVRGAVPPAKTFTVLGQVLQAFAVDHRTVVVAFLKQQGWRVDDTPNGVAGRHGDGSQIRVTFDHLGRVSDMTGQIQPR
ncbi:DUF6882 domain-containing protein [Actinoplanes derwentensis]|uniref:Uncharacterized protein n=1 Tax=Actinoplanes derwentensis TaxID=113562 RepID=A0A1H1WQK9_9ACTN|nr:DUF6882 domain-containing protein [Actinoplanes derwentensis]GID87012.1 hypothetical protein Ade03nite_59360 [Actinoplanes derwentensis]SDS99375.1 hypothetical protein SAMN04489716_2197 [Actinoplanes derwentensis]